VESVFVLRYKQRMISTAGGESETGSGEEQRRGEGLKGEQEKEQYCVTHMSVLGPSNAIGPAFSAFGLSIIWITPCLFLG
jgi:hypothetical protein